MKLSRDSRLILTKLALDGNPLTIRRMAISPDAKDKTGSGQRRCYLRVRNALRILVREKWVKRVDFGTYQVTETGKRHDSVSYLLRRISDSLQGR